MTAVDVYLQLMDGSRQFWPWAFWVGENRKVHAKSVLGYLKKELGITFDHLAENIEPLHLGAMLIFVFGCSTEAMRSVWESI